jgi:DNA repair protein RadC
MYKKSHLLGHKEKLRNRLLNSKKGNLNDHELLELLLSLTKAREDIKPLAAELITKFGNLAKVLNATQDQLLEVTGVGPNVLASLKIVYEAACRMIKEDITENPILDSWKSLIDYCRATMGHIKTEQFRVLYLDKKNMIIQDELQEIGTVDHTPVYPREIVKRALYLEASNIILVHNHPSGNTKPSQADIDMTKRIIQACHTVGITVHDHVIISSKSHFSFKTHGLM